MNKGTRRSLVSAAAWVTGSVWLLSLTVWAGFGTGPSTIEVSVTADPLAFLAVAGGTQTWSNDALQQREGYARTAAIRTDPPISEQALSELKRPHPLASRNEVDLSTQAGTWQPFVATWYSPEGGEGDGTITATGAHVRDNWTIAVDPRLIPLGSMVLVRFSDGHVTLYQAEDTGGAIKGNRFDIFDHSQADCLVHGVQRVWIRVIGWKRP